MDFGQSKDFMSHRILYAKNLTADENLAYLNSLPAKGSWIIAPRLGKWVIPAKGESKCAERPGSGPGMTN
jgi:hypothetical protein